MLDKLSGRILHIDFGDCFETAMKRKLIPEKVRFRLTRMMVLALGAESVDGAFRETCEMTLQILQKNKEPLLSVLHAFIHDPLLTWQNADAAPVPRAPSLLRPPQERAAAAIPAPSNCAPSV